jgi:EpsI family protein
METSRKILILCFLLLAVCGFVFMDDRISSASVAVNVVEKLPLEFGGWRGTAFPVDERVRSILETDYIVSRDYVNRQGQHVFLSIVYYPDNKIGFHNPESCNTGVGMKVLDNRLVPLSLPGYADGKGFEVNRLVLGMDGPAKVIYHFYVTGTAMTGNYPMFRWEMLKQQIAFRRPSGAQVQIHVAVKESVENTGPLVQEFAAALVPVLQGYF